MKKIVEFDLSTIPPLECALPWREFLEAYYDARIRPLWEHDKDYYTLTEFLSNKRERRESRLFIDYLRRGRPDPFVEFSGRPGIHELRYTLAVRDAKQLLDAYPKLRHSIQLDFPELVGGRERCASWRTVAARSTRDLTNAEAEFDERVARVRGWIEQSDATAEGAAQARRRSAPRNAGDAPGMPAPLPDLSPASSHALSAMPSGSTASRTPTTSATAMTAIAASAAPMTVIAANAGPTLGDVRQGIEPSLYAAVYVVALVMAVGLVKAGLDLRKIFERATLVASDEREAPR